MCDITEYGRVRTFKKPPLLKSNEKPAKYGQNQVFQNQTVESQNKEILFKAARQM